MTDDSDLISITKIFEDIALDFIMHFLVDNELEFESINNIASIFDNF